MSTCPDRVSASVMSGVPREARRDAVAAGADEFGQARTPHVAFGDVGVQLELDREGVGGLRVAGEESGRRHVFAAERLAHLVREQRVGRCVVRAAEDLRALRQVAARPGEVRRRDEVPIGGGIRRVVRRSRRVEPVAELEAGVPQARRSGEPRDEVDPLPGRVVLVAQDECVAELPVERPRGQHRDVAPGGTRADRRPLLAAGDDRNVPGDGAVRQLLDATSRSHERSIPEQS